MNKSAIAFWFLLVGVLMIAVGMGYKVYTDKGFGPSFSDKWGAWASIGTILASIGLVLSYKKIASGVV